MSSCFSCSTEEENMVAITDSSAGVGYSGKNGGGSGSKKDFKSYQVSKNNNSIKVLIMCSVRA